MQQAIEDQVSEYIERFKHLKDERGHCMVVKNGRSPEKSILTTIGPLPVIKPRINDKRDGQMFTSSILPRYLRRIPTIDALLPALYLKGISTGDMAEALESILGHNAPGVSATNIVRLKRIWEAEYTAWCQRRC